MQNYIQYEIATTPFNPDILSGVLWDLNILGLNEYDNFLTIFSSEDSDVTENLINEKLEALRSEKIINSYKITSTKLQSKNWNEEWEKKLDVIEVSDTIVIKPSFKDYKTKPNQIVITIDPKMSFGTGEHETTKIVLILLEKYFQAGTKILDVGSGTGVLAIASSKLGAKNVIAVDNDEWCSLNGKENIELNNIENINVVLGTIENINDNNFDIILANINKNVLIDIKDELFQKVKNNGLLILSGILQSDEDEIKRQFIRLGLTALETYQINEWIGIVFIKN
ncbi:MAG: 50S ribosomal protein L11 methyltransferase [Ignavibacteriae bacterium]|nr:MAG: 50S ribosomal protein L11 methyltransferase [Ignavibacteriota bacterium]